MKNLLLVLCILLIASFTSAVKLKTVSVREREDASDGHKAVVVLKDAAAVASIRINLVPRGGAPETAQEFTTVSDFKPRGDGTGKKFSTKDIEFVETAVARQYYAVVAMYRSNGNWIDTLVSTITIEKEGAPEPKNVAMKLRNNGKVRLVVKLKGDNDELNAAISFVSSTIIDESGSVLVVSGPMEVSSKDPLRYHMNIANGILSMGQIYEVRTTVVGEGDSFVVTKKFKNVKV